MLIAILVSTSLQKSEFWQNTFSPDVFWTAIAAIGTLLAVLVALFLPAIRSYLRNNRIERLICSEIKGNQNLIDKFTDKEIIIPDVENISAVQNNDGLTKNIDLRVWRQYQYELASDRPDSFEKYYKINIHVENILKALDHNALRLWIQLESKKDYLKEYNKLFDNEK